MNVRKEILNSAASLSVSSSMKGLDDIKIPDDYTSSVNEILEGNLFPDDDFSDTAPVIDNSSNLEISNNYLESLKKYGV